MHHGDRARQREPRMLEQIGSLLFLASLGVSLIGVVWLICRYWYACMWIALGLWFDYTLFVAGLTVWRTVVLGRGLL